jgi:glutamate-1-semialdehyde 2,1-aminomutase
MTASESEDLFEKAEQVTPGGVNSPVRAWSGVGGSPRFVVRGHGARLFDEDDNEYIDYVCSWGPLIMGHAPQVVIDAVIETAPRGTSFGAPTRAEVRLAEEIVAAVASIERVRLVNSGTEATMSALRLARGTTGRGEIVKFAGCYHGHADGLLVRAGSGATTLGVPDSPGVPEPIAGLTKLATYNDADSVRRVVGADTAAIIVEPVAGNMGLVPPAPGFLEALRQIADETGAVLIFDEVISGFRAALGGYQSVSGVFPDLTCLGKIIGGGLPVGAYGGRADLMDQVSPAGPVYQAGTLSGNPLAVAAGLATLDALRESDPYDELARKGARLADGLRRALGSRVGCVQQLGSLLTLFFGRSEVRNYDDAGGLDTQRFAAFFQAMLAEGIWLPPSQYECWFLSTAHTDQDIDATVAAAERAMAASD